MPRIPYCILIIGLAIGSPGLQATALRVPTPRLFAPGIVSGPGNEDSASFTPDGNTVVFDLSNWTSGNHAIMISHRVKGTWTRPRIAPFSGRWEDHDPVLAPDGSYLVFTSNRPPRPGAKPLADIDPKTGKTKPGHGSHLWRVTRTADGWGRPVPLPDVVNFSTRMYAPSVAADGTLYFKAPLPAPGTQHGYTMHLYRAIYRNGHYLKPTPLSVNNPADYIVDPCIAPDQSFLIFSGGFNDESKPGPRLYIVFREGEHWSQPVDMGDKLASYGPWSQHLGPNGHTLYFAGKHTLKVSYPRTPAQARRDISRMQSWGNGIGNIWSVSLTPWLPEKAGK